MNSIIIKLEEAIKILKELLQYNIEKSSTDYSIIETDIDTREGKHKNIKITFDIDITTKDKKS